MYEIRVTHNFNAAHNLRNYGGKCERLHGHTWVVEVCLKGAELNDIGMLHDFKDVKASLKVALAAYDHVYLNEISPFDKINPTAENISRVIFEELAKTIPNVAEVSVWESSNARAVFKKE